jgi:class 3 adenylate cyclase/tetratricopeptide (TPR) repeat protein
VSCPGCGAEVAPTAKFCEACGSPLQRRCPGCGSTVSPSARFCPECGTSTATDARPVAAAPSPVEPGNSSTPLPAALAERRLVSVLFADIVGFTSLSDGRDAEEVRELLSAYFERCSEIIRRYAGTVEKFIGDAVMAVWGAPVAHEDDPERAVRAGLDIIDMVAELGALKGSPALRARAGVMTGDAAVTVGAVGQGMVAGDLVNTASRIQSVAAPGTIVVGEVTRRATEASVTFEDAGEHELKGKPAPVHLWRAMRVVAGRGGSQKSTALEPPFRGRDRELRLVRDLYHVSAEDRRAQLVSILGIAGIGKTRLAWEFFKYIDGLAENIWYHRGRCLAYGEGVTYWALAEMVRMRALIVEGEDPAAAAEKLHASVLSHVTDPEERRWVEPRLAHLIGLEERAASEPADLFSAWRLFFERMAETGPTVLVFEDVQWADESLLDFIEYLLEWSKGHPLYVLTLARPELMERRPNWGAGKRNFTSLYLEPLGAQAMEELLQGLVPGLPGELVARILQRAEGVPLYAVETVRMLLDRGLLTRRGDSYAVSGDVAELDVPETLHALIAARLDGLSPDMRRVLQDAAVLGKTFTAPAVAAVSGVPVDDVDQVLRELVRAEVLSIQADPRSPEHGQFGFMQDLVRTVAFETLSRRDRKARHLAAAAWLESNWKAEDVEIVEVVAAHYLEAHRLAPDDEDDEDVRERAQTLLVRAAEHAASLAANAESQRYFEQAIALTSNSAEEATLRERAGMMARLRSNWDAAEAHFARAVELLQAAGRTHAPARVLARIGDLDLLRGDSEKATTRMEAAYAILAGDPPDADLASLAAQLARAHYLSGRLEPAGEYIRVALSMAERLRIPGLVADCLVTAGSVALHSGNQEESLALVGRGLRVALDNDEATVALRAYNNHAFGNVIGDRYAEAETLFRDGVALARRIGDRHWEQALLASQTNVLVMVGRWDEAVALLDEVAHPDDDLSVAETLVSVRVYRGEAAGARAVLEALPAQLWTAPQLRSMVAALTAMVQRAEGDGAGALASAVESIRLSGESKLPLAGERVGFVEAVGAALDMGDTARASALLDDAAGRPPGWLPRFYRGHLARYRGVLAAGTRDRQAADAWFASAIEIFTEIDTRLWLAMTQLEWAEWLGASGRDAEMGSLLASATATFEELRATPLIERARRLAAVEVIAS